jgi:hypothetical protein
VNPALGPGDSGNLIAENDTGRYDLSQGGLGGSGYTNYSAALSAAGSLHVSSLTVIVDGGWGVGGGLQQFTLSSNPLTVDANLASPEPGTMILSGLVLVGLGLSRNKLRRR